LKLLIKNIILYTFPLWLIVISFVVLDPFCLFHRDNSFAQQSTDVQSFRTFIEQNPVERYDAFVFGNSRCNSFQSKELQKHIGSDKKIFYFNAPGECVLNILKKLQFIRDAGNKINTAVILIDNGVLKNKDNSSDFFQGPVYEHSVRSTDRSYFDFYSSFINYYFTDFYFAKYILHDLTSIYTPWMKSAFNEQASSVSPSNKDSLLIHNFTEYKRVFKPNFSRKYVPANVVTRIDSDDLERLKQISQILQQEGTQYCIIIPPDFHLQQVPTDIRNTLFDVFGASRVFDFTGENAITMDSTMNYEGTHFSNRAGKMILDSIFTSLP
jgi:hypothetical protein